MQTKIAELLEALEGASNLMRGLWLDPAVPAHAKGALLAKAEELDALVQTTLSEDE